MSIVYPRPPKDCPPYFDVGDGKWQDEVRQANNFGIKHKYSIGDEVETISFYFPNSQAVRRNEVVIEKGKIDSIYKFESGRCSYTVVFPDGCGKITSYSHLRTPIQQVDEND